MFIEIRKNHIGIFLVTKATNQTICIAVFYVKNMYTGFLKTTANLRWKYLVKVKLVSSPRILHMSLHSAWKDE